MTEQLSLSGITENTIFEGDDSVVDSGKTPAKVVKLRFTAKQYATFREACKIFKVISLHPGFTDFVVKAIDSDVTIQTSSIQKQLVNPIVEAPLRIPHKTESKGTEKKESYFTNPVPVTNEVKKLYYAVSRNVDKGSLKQNIDNGLTCVTDVRGFFTKFIHAHKLNASEHGVEISKQFASFAPKVIKSEDSNLKKVNDKSYIPKGNRKIITLMVNEVLFGK